MDGIEGSGSVLESGDSGARISAPTSQRWGCARGWGWWPSLAKTPSEKFGAASICVPELCLLLPSGGVLRGYQQMEQHLGGFLPSFTLPRHFINA